MLRGNILKNNEKKNSFQNLNTYTQKQEKEFEI